ncbi:uncharacterized protein DNG_04543 [Cephalotrichum gorgonifer]|uniref:F-box domain-containing protein n=1 Tax=Cephalotrichum gorgonifer TaxID=2041049 RepID=A0AAE8MZ15_9PEZI|nr:uncharacterized protein DNG_04543 [Cephalotrichum gorgonifer]
MLADLPNELLQCIAASLDAERDIAALARTNQNFFRLLGPYLYRRNTEFSGSSALFWAAVNGRLETARKSIEAGASGKCRSPKAKGGRSCGGPGAPRVQPIVGRYISGP